jgi:hypothetical protein
MVNQFCYWTISWGDYDYMAQSLIDSARKVGVQENFYAFTQKPINNCINFRLNPDIENDQLQFFKFQYLQKEMSKFKYEYFIFIDSDHFFVRKPEITINEIMMGDPWHSFLESPVNSPKTQRADWWGIPNNVFETIMRRNGVTSSEIRNTNGGFWICHKDFINTAVDLAYNFHNNIKQYGFTVPEEVSIAYLSHLMSPKIENRFVERFAKYWSTDWISNFANRLPINEHWVNKSYMTYEELNVNPSIVHAMRSKNMLIQNGRKLLNQD